MNNTSSYTNTTENVRDSIEVGNVLAAMVMSGIGLIENSIVVVLLFTRKRLRKRPHVLFILCLSVSDVMISLNVMMSTAAYFTPLIHSASFCIFIFTTAVIFFGMSLMQALIIAVERLLAVSATIRYINAFNGKRKYAVMMISLAILTIYAIIVVTAFPPIQNPPSCNELVLFRKQDKIYIDILTQGYFVPVTLVTVIIYALAALKLRKKIRQVAESDTTRKQTPNLPSKTTASPSTTLESDPTNSAKGLNNTNQVEISSLAVPINNIREFTTSQTSDGSPEARNIARLKNETSSIPKLTNALKTVAFIELCLFISFVPPSILTFLRMGAIDVTAIGKATRSLPVLHPVVNPILYLWCIKEFRNEVLCRRHN